MTFSDIFNKGFLEMVYTGDISLWNVLILMLICCLFSVYIFVFYRLIRKDTFYNKNMGITIGIVSIITMAIVVTLGMVGALSIVRFRTAIKEPLDLMFLFWSISNGIIIGAGLPGIATMCSIVVTIGVVLLENIPSFRASLILVVNATEIEVEKEIVTCIKNYSKSYEIKSRTIENGNINLLFELRTKNDNVLVQEISKIKSVNRCSLLQHNGDITY